MTMDAARWTGMVALSLSALGCQASVGAVPDAEEAASYYDIPARTEFEVRGNVAEVEVWQSADHLRRGGALWAKVGPYVYLFSEPTRDLFTDYEGLAAVRVVTRDPGAGEIARATLRRDALNDITWKRALNVSGRARLHGGRKLGLLSELVEWGEDHTDFEYNPLYTR